MDAVSYCSELSAMRDPVATRSGYAIQVRGGGESEFEVRAKPALAITMGLHELSTNAGKYGALSVEGGDVEPSWKLVLGEISLMKWIE